LGQWLREPFAESHHTTTIPIPEDEKLITTEKLGGSRKTGLSISSLPYTQLLQCCYSGIGDVSQKSKPIAMVNELLERCNRNNGQAE
jgi:hypothetical protein